MPCSGPNCTYAAAQGDKAYAEFAAWLKESHGIPTLDEIAKDSNPRWFKFTKESHEKLREAVRDLFVSDVCDNW